MQVALPVKQPVERQTIGLAALVLVGMAAIPVDGAPVQDVTAAAIAEPGVAIQGEGLKPNESIAPPARFSSALPHDSEASDERSDGDALKEGTSSVKSMSENRAHDRAPSAPERNFDAENSGSSPGISEETLREKVVQFALTWEGTPYLWGGNTRSGVDCSGFVQSVYAHIGIKLPRTSYEQFRQGVGISRHNLAPGDLVFFSTNGPGASHVGIYLGNDQFISATRRQVEIQYLSDSYWQKAYRGCRRII